MSGRRILNDYIALMGFGTVTKSERKLIKGTVGFQLYLLAVRVQEFKQAVAQAWPTNGHSNGAHAPEGE